MMCFAGSTRAPYETRRLWSLWEMIEHFDVRSMYLLARHIQELKRTLSAVHAARGNIIAAAHVPADKFANTMRIMGNVPEGIRTHFPSFARQAERISRMDKNDLTVADLNNEMNELSRRMEEELEVHLFFQMTSHRQYYDTPMLFGSTVNDKFPEAIDDIEEAGKCIALSRGTGAVMHLMRVMEAGLKALAKMLAIPYAPSWESYLTQISNKIAAKHKTKGIRWKRDEPFFRDISGDLVIIKQAWRNPTMHIVRKYGPEEAEEIFRAVRNLMQRLASR
jgi:hypothetical protein